MDELNMSIIAFSIISMLTAIICIIGMWLYTKRLHKEIELMNLKNESLNKDVYTLKADNQDLKNQLMILNDNYLTVLERLAKK